MPLASGRASTRFRDPHCWPNWSKRPALSADPNRNPTAPTPLSPATAESETHDTGAAAAPRTTTGEKKKTGSFLSSAPPEAAAGMGNLGVGSKSNLAAGNREASALLGTAPCRCGLHVDVSREEEDGARLCLDGTARVELVRQILTDRANPHMLRIFHLRAAPTSSVLHPNA